MSKRLLMVIAILASIVALLPAIGPRRSAAAPLLAGRVHAEYQPNHGKIFILVIGSDARSGNPDGANADAIHIVGINTHTMKGGILNFPRDSWVNGSKINSSMLRGGPLNLAQTLESLTGIHLDYWVMTGFFGFTHIVRALDGLKMHIPTEVHDAGFSGANLNAGTQVLAPGQALAYVRARHPFRDGDLARTTHQADLLLALLRKFKGNVADGPASLLRWISVARQYTRLDIPPQEMFHLAILASQLSATDIGNVTVPASLGMVGAASVVYISPSAHSIYARFRKHASL
jgi:LCP family protein required for cell wall assembly